MYLIIFSGLPGTGKSILADAVLVQSELVRSRKVTGFHRLPALDRLAERYQAKRLVIECVCSDEAFHHSSPPKRERNIPGWRELEWSEVEKVRGYFLPWEGKRLVLDRTNPFEDNLAKAIAYCE
jgi:hypothetical protein